MGIDKKLVKGRLQRVNIKANGIQNSLMFHDFVNFGTQFKFKYIFLAFMNQVIIHKLDSYSVIKELFVF